MTVLQIKAKTEKIDKAGATFWELETQNGKHRAWERNNPEGLEVGRWYECETTQEGKFLPQIQKSVQIDASSQDQPSGGGPDMMAVYPPAVPQEVWEMKDRAIAMESAIHSAALVAQAIGQGLLVGSMPIRDGAMDFLGLADMFYNHIQEARNGGFINKPAMEKPRGAPVPDMRIPRLLEKLGWDVGTGRQNYLDLLHTAINYKDGTFLTDEERETIVQLLTKKVEEV